MNAQLLNPFAHDTPDSVEATLDDAEASCARFNRGDSIFSGHYLATGRTDGFVTVWDIETRSVLRWLEGHVKTVTSVDWSRFNRYLASSSLDWNVIVWDLKTDLVGDAAGGVVGGSVLHHRHRHHQYSSSRRRTLRFDSSVLSVQFDPSDSGRLLVVLENQEAFLVDIRDRLRVRVRESYPVDDCDGFKGIEEESLSPDPSLVDPIPIRPPGSRLEEEGIQSIDLDRSPPRKIPLIADPTGATASQNITAAKFSPDGRKVFAGTSKGAILVFETSTGELLKEFKSLGSNSGVRELSFDRSGKHLVVNSNDRAIRILNVTTVASTPDDAVPEGEHLDSESSTGHNHKNDQGVDNDDDHYQDGRHGEGNHRRKRRKRPGLLDLEVKVQHKFQDLVNRTPWNGVGFSGDSEYVMGGAANKAAHNVYIWDRASSSLVKILEGPREPLIDVDWHPTRPMLASVSTSGAVYLWLTPVAEIWSAYAPGFEELEENVEYEEREDEFDLEDEDELSRRKNDEEEAMVDILSSGPFKDGRGRRSSRSGRWGGDGAASLGMSWRGYMREKGSSASANRGHLINGAGSFGDFEKARNGVGDGGVDGSLNGGREESEKENGGAAQVTDREKEGWVEHLVYLEDDDDDPGFVIPPRLEDDLQDFGTL
ncbi:WD40 repeat-like protein [Violaceomyces palustris]|uniref:WD40 repeat-like protein n=1 Tax=Violaceomyces palustris TaxID=1673888 RepID=A0ACD0NRA0_9BASI|nr:WD40 repeat-like protein [Violaceomyces palustris]